MNYSWYPAAHIERSYNNRQQMTQLWMRTADWTERLRYNYSYGEVNQTTGVVDSSKNNGQVGKVEGYISGIKQWDERFSYDSLGRLDIAGEYRGDTGAMSWRLDYDYDRYGNRLQTGGQNYGLTYTQVQSSDINTQTNRFTNGVTYNDGGEIISDSKFRGQQYQYDANGRMTWSANTDGSGAADSVYNGSGHRVQTTSNGVTRTFVYDVFGRLAGEYFGSTRREMTYRGNELISIRENGWEYYVISDRQGSARAVVDMSGNLVSRHDYLPFGEEIQAGVGMRTTSQGYGASDNVRQRYAETERDEASGLEHTLWRKVDTLSGRWTSPDPYRGSMEVHDPQSFNRYAYVQNDPVNLVDPDGLKNKLPDVIVINTWAPYYHDSTLDGFGSWWGWFGDDGFGGNYDGDPVPDPDSFRDAVEKSFDRVAKILDDPDSECTKFFGPHAKEALEAMRQKMQVAPKPGGPGGTSTGISQSGYPGGVDAIPSGPYRTPGVFTVYTNGPFFMLGTGTIAGYRPGSPMAQNAAILHELAHNIKNDTGDGFLIPNDGPGTREGLSADNTELIKKKCGDQIFRGH